MQRKILNYLNSSKKYFTAPWKYYKITADQNWGTETLRKSVNDQTAFSGKTNNPSHMRSHTKLVAMQVL